MRPAEHPSEDGKPGRDSAGASAECSNVVSRDLAPAWAQAFVGGALRPSPEATADRCSRPVLRRPGEGGCRGEIARGRASYPVRWTIALRCGAGAPRGVPLGAKSATPPRSVQRRDPACPPWVWRRRATLAYLRRRRSGWTGAEPENTGFRWAIGGSPNSRRRRRRDSGDSTSRRDSRRSGGKGGDRCPSRWAWW